MKTFLVVGLICRDLCAATTSNPRRGVSLGGPPARDSDVVVPCDMIEAGDANLSGSFRSADYIGPSDALEIPWGGWGLLWKHGEDDQAQSNRPGILQRIKQEIAWRHGGNYNVAFCDAHIESIGHQKLYSTNDAAVRRWNTNHDPWP